MSPLQRAGEVETGKAGGETIDFADASGDAASLYGAGGDSDMVDGSGGSIYLSDGQASVVGGGDAIVLTGALAPPAAGIP